MEFLAGTTCIDPEVRSKVKVIMLLSNALLVFVCLCIGPNECS